MADTAATDRKRRIRLTVALLVAGALASYAMFFLTMSRP